MSAKLTDPEREQAARIVVLFSVLVHAWQTNDFAEAARARSELDDLDIKVRLPRAGERKGVEHE